MRWMMLLKMVPAASVVIDCNDLTSVPLTAHLCQIRPCSSRTNATQTSEQAGSGTPLTVTAPVVVPDACKAVPQGKKI